MSVQEHLLKIYNNLKEKTVVQLQAVSMDIESLIKIDIANLPITKLLFQLVVAIVAVFATGCELVAYLTTSSFKQLFPSTKI